MSKFGWDYPPGCTQRMVDEAMGSDAPCECCGRWSDDCICPECPVCGESGNPKCYTNTADDKGHGGDYCTDQLIGQEKLKIQQFQERISDCNAYIAYLESKKDQTND